MPGYIIHDVFSGILWGAGATEADAWLDARRGAAEAGCELDESALRAVPATSDLITAVVSGGGQWAWCCVSIDGTLTATLY